MRKLWVLVTVVAIGAIVIAGAVGPSMADAAQATTYRRTIIGTDFHSLDSRLGVQFVPDTGGGVFLVGGLGGEVPGDAYLEANVDLPVGAKIKNIVIYFKDCGPNHIPSASWYFGSYSPSGGFLYEAPSTEQFSCAFTDLTLVPGGDVRVLASRRYVVGMATAARRGMSSDPAFVLRGARIAYTCPTKCLP